VSTLLTVAGEKAVLRIFDRDSMLISLEKLGLAKYDEEIFKTLVSKPHGIILVTGPTGSGKTTTLYAILSQMNSETDNIVTIENPVEYKLNRINQIQVDPTAKITFATGLRTILRQDPDNIMVGEIRDTETAEIAVQAALTGHLVLSTLHTNDAPSAVTRLIDMGIEPFLISSTVIGTLAQRLCRTVCPECREEYIPTAEEAGSMGLELKAGEKLARGKGCDFCYNTGYKGRTGIFEIMKVSDGIRELILRKEPTIRIKELAIKEGMRTLQQNGARKVLNKVSTIEEVKRVVYMD
jgi:type IV pilus assembly protein PilB